MHPEGFAEHDKRSARHNRVAEVVRKHEGPSPKSLDWDENFRQKSAFLGQKQCFLGKKCVIIW